MVQMKTKGYNLAQTRHDVQTLQWENPRIFVVWCPHPGPFEAGLENIDEFLDSPPGAT